VNRLSQSLAEAGFQHVYDVKSDKPKYFSHYALESTDDESAGRGIRTPAAPRGHKLLGPPKGISRLAPYLARRPRH
jgi:hypothetical protein